MELPSLVRTLTASETPTLRVLNATGARRCGKRGDASERAAVREARAILAARDGGDRVVAAGLTLDELVERDYLPMLDSLVSAGRRSERGVELYRDRYRVHLAPAVGRLRLGDVDARRVAATRRALPGLVSCSPLDGLDPAELPRPDVGNHGRVLDEAELAALVRHAPEPYGAIVTVLAYTGLRLSEALGPRWRDVDLVEAELRVEGQLTVARRGRPRGSSRRRPRPAVAWSADAHGRAGARRPRAGSRFAVEAPRTTSSSRPGSGRRCTRGTSPSAASRAPRAPRARGRSRRTTCGGRSARSGRRGVDSAEAARMTGHSLAVWTRHYARSFGKAQRDQAPARLVEHGFGVE